MRTIYRGSLWLAVALIGVGCGGSDLIVPPTLPSFPPIHEVVIYTWPTYVQVGDTLRVQAAGFNASGWEFTQPIRTVVWQTSNPEIITIEPAAALIPIQPSVYARGVAPGIGHISAALNGISGSDSVIVVPALRGIEVSPQTATIHVGQSVSVTSRIVAADGSIIVGPYIIWNSSDFSVAAFGPGNTVLGLGAGTARITATLARAVGTMDVTVLP